MLIPFYFMALLTGLVFGSFLNVCIYRLPLGRSIVGPRSHCPFCGRGIEWRDNVPLVSFLLLKGKCRNCKRPIPLRYFIVELLTGVLAVLVYHFFQTSFAAVVYFIFLCALIVVTFIDIEHKEIPDVISLPGIPLGLAASAAVAFFAGAPVGPALLGSFLGILAGGGSMFVLGITGEMLFRKEALGGGDVKLMAMIGAFLGWELVLLTFFLAPIFGSVGGLITRFRSGSEHIAYGPYLCGAALISLFWGARFLEYLFRLYSI